MVRKHYDIAVIGAGIHGAGVAQAAAAHGYSVVVLEKSGVASGTSSRSSKLIHGGLRYLETAQIRLVRECLRERSILLRIAPDLVKLSPFYIPVYRSTKRRPWQLRLGLSVYAALGGLNRESFYRAIPRNQWQELDGLTGKELQAVFSYYDAQTDDVELTKSVMQSALELGAELFCPAEFIHADIKQLCEIDFNINNSSHSCQVDVIVNAAGPWVNHVLGRIAPKMDMHPVDYVQGAHIVVDSEIQKGVYYLEAPQDGRVVFVIPWKNRVMLGTTETLVTNISEPVHPTKSEVDYLLSVYQYYFPTASVTQVDIVDRFAGLRVLPADSHSAFKRARDTLLVSDNKKSPRIISLYGGKLTAYRATAQRIMRELQFVLPPSNVIADTRTIRLRPLNNGD